MDTRLAVRRAVSLSGDVLRVRDVEFDLNARELKIYSVALGKAAVAMASALDEILGARLEAGIVTTTPNAHSSLSNKWRAFAGGHPLPNEASLDAARAALTMLRRADSPSTLIIFLISGGGSAMLELPRDARVPLEDLREANRVLVQCGASITEINVVRRALSKIKGGGLSACAPQSSQISLIVSDTGAGREADVASGPTAVEFENDFANAARSVVEHYDLARRLPFSINRALKESVRRERETTMSDALRKHFVLLDNERAMMSAADEARARGYVVEFARDISEQHVTEGSAALVSRLVAFHKQHDANERGVCLIAGGEFSCPVRGAGVGGRNAETALRCALEMDAQLNADGSESKTAGQFVALCAGTDGIDGNSPAAGAISDHTTIRRARALNLNARQYLEESDAYTFFNALGETVLTGATGTNVRDLRILLAR